MDKIEKLLRKISHQDRQHLLEIIEQLLAGDWPGLNITKVKGTDFYRLRSRRFRLIFHRDPASREVIIDHIRLKNEQTYKRL